MKFLINFLRTRAIRRKIAAENSARLIMHIRSATNGRISHFYDVTGQQIRGWHRPPIGIHQHPLIAKYF